MTFQGKLVKATVILMSCCILYIFLTEQNRCKQRTAPVHRKDFAGKHNIQLQELTVDLTKIVDLTRRIPRVQMHAKNALGRAVNMLKEYNVDFPAQETYLTTVGLGQHRTNTTLLDVCPEKYLGTSADYPCFEKGRVLTNCTNAPPFPTVISILLNGFDYVDKRQILVVLREIYATYPRLTVHLAVREKIVIPEEVKLNVLQHIFGKSAANDVWNGLVEKATTDYVLVGRRIERFQWYAVLERMVRVVSELGVGAVGGALRTPDGHWSMGCQQTRLRNYTVTYRDGYHMSTNSCAYCDYIPSPFVSRTSTLRAVKFRMASPDTVFHDYFMRLQKDRTLVMSCPDSMFYVLENSETATSLHQQWIPMVQTYAINEVNLADGRHLSFSCSEAKSSCTSKAGIIQPVCCIKVLSKAVVDIMDICAKLDVFCHLDGGTELGAMKLNGILPWEVDADLSYVVLKNVSFWDHRDEFTKLGYTLKLMFPGDCRRFDPTNGRCNHFIVAVSGWLFELWGSTPRRITDFLAEHHLQATKLYLGGRWLNANTSPGIGIRNRYGYEILRHAEHWRNLHAKDSWVVYKPAKFLKCPDPGGHYCLDQYVADGSFAFTSD